MNRYIANIPIIFLLRAATISFGLILSRLLLYLPGHRFVFLLGLFGYGLVTVPAYILKTLKIEQT